MKALQELGIVKVYRYVWTTLAYFLIRISLYSPIRIALLRFFGVTIGKNSVVHDIKIFNIYHHGFTQLTIGSNCFLGDDVMLDLKEKITLEDFATLSNRTLVLTHTNVGYAHHPLQKFIPRFEKPVVFRYACFIGAGVTIMPGVTIGKQAVVGACTLVNKNVSDKHVVAGVPARIIRKLQ